MFAHFKKSQGLISLIHGDFLGGGKQKNRKSYESRFKYLKMLSLSQNEIPVKIREITISSEKMEFFRKKMRIFQ